MDQENNDIITSSTGVRLKKVKRPIRRIMPENPPSPQVPQENTAIPPRNPFSAQSQNTAGGAAPDSGDFDLDSFLDEPENLPAVNNQVQEYNSNEQPQFIDENSFDYAPQESFLTGGETVSRRIAIIAASVALVLGFTIAKLFFSEQKVVRDGLQGVVINAEVPRGRARCGVAEKTQGCVLYLMNPQRQELNARDFYDLASQLTGRQRFVIETGNMRYSSTKIKPGEIGQFNIPPLQ